MLSINQAKAWYRHDDPVHGFDHILRVLALAELIAKKEGADLEIVSAAALLHDASGGDLEEGKRENHHEASADFARKILLKEGWPADRIGLVIDCIHAHRYRGETKANSLEAKILYDADKLDVLGAFGIARTVAYAVQAGQSIFAEVSKQFMETGQVEESEGHSAYHEYIFKLSKVAASLHTETAKKMANKRHALLTSFFEALAEEADLSKGQ